MAFNVKELMMSIPLVDPVCSCTGETFTTDTTTLLRPETPSINLSILKQQLRQAMAG
jgi:hypothetical protein